MKLPKESKLERCGHIDVSRDSENKVQMDRCTIFTGQKGHMKDGKKVYICKGHLHLYPKP